MPKHRTRVGINGRNAVNYIDADYALVRRAKIETIKTLSLTNAQVHQRIRQENPDIEFIVRLYDDRFRPNSRPNPAEFVARMVPVVKSLQPYATKFEIHNEPNHMDGLEGWGPSDDQAKAFLAWYTKILRALRESCPWAKFGFPGLALNDPHRDLEWLDICREAISASDWLGCHCYWQYGNMLSEEWGHRFRIYHTRFPDKTIEITEFGNSTPNLSADEIATQYARYYQELNKYPYLGSASAFIASSPDPAWARFVWAKDSGEMLPVVEAIATMERKPVEYIKRRTYPQTGKTVEGIFLEFLDRYGLRITGYPITNQLTEKGNAVQYFQRIALQEHEPGKLRLMPVGKEAWASRKKIADLEARVEELSNQPGLNVEKLIAALTSLVASLAELIKQLQQELARAEAGQSEAGANESRIVTSLRQQTATLRETSDKLQVELDAALKAKREDQAALISYLKSRIESLLEEIKELKEKPPVVPDDGSAIIERPPIQYVVDQLPKHETERYETRSRSEIQGLIIHHSAAPASVLGEQIAAYHIRKWDWPGIGYHFLVGADGAIYQTNALETVSFHAGAQNQTGVGICFLGNFMVEVPPPEQLTAGAHLVAWLMQDLNLTEEAIKGHREVMQTNCPGNQWLSGKHWKAMLLEEIAGHWRQPEQPDQQPADGAIYHYLLLPDSDGDWDEKLWAGVARYVAAFHPSVGLRTNDAAHAENVTLVGGPSRIPQNVEDWLRVHGCRVDRIAGSDDADTRRMLDELAAQGKRFLTSEG